jgi:hypothetical protein
VKIKQRTIKVFSPQGWLLVAPPIRELMGNRNLASEVEGMHTLNCKQKNFFTTKKEARVPVMS